ncbi:hypothetical protein ACU5AX_07875 [Sphingomonas sp. XXL09]|nr:hypothetical protein [Sphingomonas sp. MA1305]
MTPELPPRRRAADRRGFLALAIFLIGFAGMIWALASAAGLT